MLWERLAYADLGTADCMVADNTTMSYPQGLELKNASVVPDGPFN